MTKNILVTPSPSNATARAASTEPRGHHLLNVKEAIAYLGLRCSPTRLYEMARKGDVPCVRFGRRVLFSTEQLDARIAEGGRVG